MEKPHSRKKSLILWASTLFGIGLIPYAPGTMASLAGLAVFLLVETQALFLAVTIASVILAFLLCGKAARLLGKKDPKEVVIDDFSGQLIALLFMPKEPVYIFICFLLFRIFDTTKIPPADIFDRKEGSLGIVGDDVVAGLYANLVVQAVRIAVNISS
ncbi:phosphatidylglycerophosphatase A [Candidatus Omnitrophota bacterium]